MSILILSYFLFLTNSFVRCELYTAISELEQLLETELLLINTLKAYISKQEDKLNILKSYSYEYQAQYKAASGDIELYLSNPINAFLLVKRLSDWSQVEILMNSNVGEVILANFESQKPYLKFPSNVDLNGAAVALIRLQDLYGLSTSSLARGELNGVKYSAEMNAAECFEIGRQAHYYEDYHYSQLWMKEADKRLDSELDKTVQRSDVLEYLAHSYYRQGKFRLALDLTKQIIKMDPQHPRALVNKGFYEDAVINARGMDDLVEDDLEDFLHTKERETYNKLCRGEIKTPIKLLSQLKCFYQHSKENHFVNLAPFKVEEVYINPKILIFHEVISDKEIASIKEMAQSRLHREISKNLETGEDEAALYRISKQGWLQPHEHQHVASLYQRVEDMTGLSMQTAEDLQVVNYGIGGHYEPHYDFSEEDNDPFSYFTNKSERIATVLFYMSDVSQGGATAFLNIKLALWPRKGSAAFWYNLHASGDGDKNTLHGACPVLIGSKWVSNYWIHEEGQEFRRPCGLERTPTLPTS